VPLPFRTCLSLAPLAGCTCPDVQVFREAASFGIVSGRARSVEMARGNVFESAYRILKRVPRGRVITYAQLARMAGLPGGARTAGRAMASCPQGRGIPWHRVVGAGGRILVREPYASLQRRLLEGEGTESSGARIDLERHSWVCAKKSRAASRKRRR
jgi:methylated-DNA-protein-cysteine methyltransferase-like protein